MEIKRKRFAGQHDSYLLKNDNGMQVQIGLIGAAIERIALPDAGGKLVNVVLGFEDYEKYAENTLCAGAAVGPVAGRIENSSMEIDGQSYTLTANENGITCLHGGNQNASFQTWAVTQAYANEGKAILGLSLLLPDGLEGFPGNRHLNAVYELDNRNCLTVRYDGVTDKKTYLSMTNHSYFNLSGDFRRSGLGQKLSIPAAQYLRTDEKNIPVALVSVEGTPYDFREEHVIQENLDAYPDNKEIGKAKGLDNGFDIRQAAASGRPIVTLRDEESGRALTITSPTSQSVVVYTGGFIGDSYALADGVISSDSCAVALECQAFPNAIHHQEWEPQITAPGQIYRHEIRYQFHLN